MELTAEQKQAIENANGDMVITAAAGAGKTFVLTEMVARIIETEGVPPQQLVVITFTEKAARELKERLAIRLGQSTAYFDDCPIGTIHAFAAGLLRERPAAHLKDFVIWEGHRASLEASRLVHDELRRLLISPSDELAALFEEYGWRVLVGMMTQLLNMRWLMRAVAGRDVAAPLWPAVQELYEKIRTKYVTHKQRHGAYDFEDLEEEALVLLSQDDERRRFQDRFRHILVDEYQDISPPQYEMIRLLHRGSTNRLVVVGDPLQSIYRFRGAEVALFDQTRAYLQTFNAAEVELRTNFRSTTDLIDVFNSIFKELFASTYRPMRGLSAGDGASPLTIVPLPKTRNLSERRQVEAELVVKQIGNLLQAGRSTEDVAVLFRSRAAMSEYETALNAAQIPFSSQSGNLLFEQPEILDQINAMRALCRPHDRVALSGLMVSPLGGVPELGLWGCRGRSGNHQMLQNRAELTAAERVGWADFEKWWLSFKEETLHLKASEVAVKLLQRGLSRGFYKKGQERANLRQWVDFLSWMEQVDPFELEDLLSVIEGFREDGARIFEVDHQHQGESGVQLMTVHGAKGLEFPIVVVADLSAAIPTARDPILIDAGAGIGMRQLDADSRGLRDQMIDTDDYVRVKDAIRSNDLAESRRLLYVACTRARDSLILPLDRYRVEKQPTWNKWLCEALADE